MRRNHILILCAALIATLPLITGGCSCGHDFDFHIQSWLDAAQQLRHGTLLPHWAFSPAYNAGEPRFIFYPPLSWMLGAILTLIFPIAALPAIYTFIALAAAGLSMHRLASHFAAPNAALLTSILYIANPYMLFTAFERTAYAELLAAAWLPLLFLAILRDRPTIRGIALPIALLWLTNAPAAVMGCYALAFIVIVRLIFSLRHPERTRHPERSAAQPKDLPNPQPRQVPRILSTTSPAFNLALTSTAGTLLGLTLPAFYLVPAAYERRFVQIAMAIIPNMRFQDNFLFAHTGDGPHDQVLHTASLLALTLLIGTATTLLAVYLTRTKKSVIPTEAQNPHAVISTEAKRSGEIPAFTTPNPTPELSSRPSEARGETRSTPAIILILLTLTIAFLLTPLSTPLWNHLPDLAFLQFPWRLLSILAVVLALAITLLLRKLNPRTAITLPLAAALIAALTFTGIHNFRQGCDDTDYPSVRAQLFRAHQGVQPTDEYTPNLADNDVLRTDDPSLWLSPDPASFAPGTTPNPAAPNAPVTTPSTVGPGCTVPLTFAPDTINVFAPTPEFAILNLRRYPSWRITVNGHDPALYAGPARDDGLTVIPIDKGASALRISWHRTLDQQLGLALTALALCMYAFLSIRARSRRIKA